MILHYFRDKENKDQKISDIIYLNIIKKTRNICDETFDNNKKDFNLVFEISSILLIVVYMGLNRNSNFNSTILKEGLMSLFIKDLDYSLRYEGVSDIKIGKLVKLYVKKFYYRIPLIEEIFKTKKPDLLISYLEKFQIITNNQANKNIDILSFFHYLEGLLYEIEKIKKIEKLNIKLLK